MEQQVSKATGLDIEVPFYVDDIMACVLDREGVENVKEVLKEVDKGVGLVAAKWDLPLEKEKHEEIVFNQGGLGSGKKKKRSEVEKVKWLGIIVDDTLDFDHYWKSRHAKARQLPRSLNSMASSQWGISPSSWRQLYTGMIRVVALWGAELGWKGHKSWQKEFERLQYQALRKCTGTTLGASRERVNYIARVEDVKTILDSTQVRYLARCAIDPATTSDLWDAPPLLKKPTVVDQLLAQARVKSKEEIEWGGDIDSFELHETNLQCGPSTSKSIWEKAISLTKRTPIYTDSSKSDGGVVGGGYYLQQGQLGVRVGMMATVWDGEITGMRMGLRAAGNTEEKVIILSDSKAAIQAVINAGQRGTERTRDLAHLRQQILNRQDLYGQDNVAVGWVKAHVGIEGKERADEMAKMCVVKEERDHVTEGGLQQWEKGKRRENRV